jgi:8-oxo-dGTP pyrophosphatase MutT (NUDIX family)
VQKIDTFKVVCYIVRDDRLLVFRHVGVSDEECGIQVPAGTIKAGESPSQAALREAAEETGLEGIEIIRELAQGSYDITPERYERQHRHYFQLRLTHPAPDRWTSWELHDGLADPTEFECFWIPLTDAHILQSGQASEIWRMFEPLEVEA